MVFGNYIAFLGYNAMFCEKVPWDSHGGGRPYGNLKHP